MNRATMVGRIGIVAVAGLASAASAGIQNGGFETGDLTGWTSNLEGNDPSFLAFATTGIELSPTQGSYHARLQSGKGANVYTTLTSSPFNLAAGQEISGDFYLASQESFGVPDDGFVKLLDSNNVEVATLIALNRNQYSGFASSSGWLPFDYTATSSLTGLRLQVGVRNFSDNQNDSAVGVDNIQLSALTVIPLPTGVGIAAAGLFAVGIRRSRAARIEAR